MVSVGSGMINISDIVRSAEQFLEWLIVDLSTLVIDEIESVKESYCYLVNRGLCSV